MYYIFIDNNTSYPDGRSDKIEEKGLGPFGDRQSVYDTMEWLMKTMSIFPAIYRDIRLDGELSWEIVHVDGCRSIGRAYAKEVIEVAD